MFPALDFKPVIDLLIQIRDELRKLNAFQQARFEDAKREKDEMIALLRHPANK